MLRTILNARKSYGIIAVVAYLVLTSPVQLYFGSPISQYPHNELKEGVT